MAIILALTIGIIPSVAWLFFYLKHDRHPEPKATVLFVFLMGILAAPAAIFAEYYFGMYVYGLPINNYLKNLVIVFITIAMVEEVLKFLAVRLTMLKNHEFDEPVDAMIYLIVAALGFAAAENVLYFYTADNVVTVVILRFWGATFLHTLASGIVGYYLALSMREKGVRSGFLVVQGIIMATGVHGFFNYLLFSVNSFYSFFIIPLIMIISALFVFKCFKSLKKKLSICEI